MTNEGVFWINLWRTIGAVFIGFVAILSVYNHYDGIRYTEMWNNCVNAGGQPTRQPMMGSESTTFTCVRNG